MRIVPPPSKNWGDFSRRSINNRSYGHPCGPVDIFWPFISKKRVLTWNSHIFPTKNGIKLVYPSLESYCFNVFINCKKNVRKCRFRDVDRRERLGCQSQTKIVWGSCFTFIVSCRSSSHVTRDTSLIDLSRNILLFPLLSKKDAKVAQCFKKSEFWLHIRRTRMNCPL